MEKYDFYASDKKIKKDTSDILTGSWGLVLKFTSLFLLFITLITGGAVTICLFYPLWYVIVISAVVGTILNYYFIYGYQVFFSNFVNKSSAKYSNLFAGFKMPIKLIKILIEKIFMFIFGLVLVLIGGVVNCLAYSMTSLCLKDDPSLKATHVLKQSSRLMNENKTRLFRLQFKNLFWCLLVPTIIGAFWAIPHLVTTKVVFYEDLKTDF